MSIAPQQSIKVVAVTGLLLLLLGCGQRSPPAENLLGSYQHRHQVFVFHGSEPTEVEVIDRLIITESDNQLSIDLMLHTISGETCLAKGPVDWRGDAYVYTVGNGVKRSECVFRLMPESSAVVVESSGISCQEACSGVDVTFNPVTYVPPNMAD